MSVTLLKIILFLFLFSKNSNSLSIINFTINSINHSEFHKLPRFWTNTGFCPWGNVQNSTEITNSLLSNHVQRNIELIGALSNNGIQTIRIHWLLELIDFIKFSNETQQKPEYNFEKLDKFLKRINKSKLAIGFEFMGNPGNVFSLYENVSKSFLWENLSYQIVERYLKIFGDDTVKKWKFESWNEPDLKNYNLLKFNQSDYLAYALSLRQGINAASQTLNSTKLKLYGPAGLFKKINRHPLCWSILEFCNNNQQICPFDVITFHRKGEGLADDVFSGGKKLIKEITEKYPKLKTMKFANNEADPIAGWSTPRSFQSDIRYAVDVLKIITQHWNGMINNSEFSNFEYISHDNGFLSYWPYVFEQRTLLAHFQMNNSYPKYSQFIQKPVYIALGMISNLAKYAKRAQILPNNNLTILITLSNRKLPLYIGILLFSDTINQKKSLNINLPLQIINTNEEKLCIIVEGLITDITDPVKIWNYYDRPSYPNSTIRMIMRSVQGPIILQQNEFQLNSNNKTFQININSPLLNPPWIIFIRICNLKISSPFKPFNLRIRNITNGEIMILWNEIYRNEKCLMTYQIYFSKFIKDNWIIISNDDHVPFLSYHFQPSDGITQGYYKVRGIDIFGRKGEFSKVKSFF